jgi:hypothetical protein
MHAKRTNRGFLFGSNLLEQGYWIRKSCESVELGLSLRNAGCKA